MRAGELIADRFEIEYRAHTGGMGAVYKARDVHDGQAVAVKVLRSQFAHEEIERFVHEAQLLASLDHPGIVRHIAHGTTRSGEHYLALEWLDGEDLGARLTRNRLSPTETVTLLMHAAEAMAQAHRRGIVHRDIKPSNLFLVGGRVDQVKLLDFGIARGSAADVLSSTQTGIVLGTPMYMSPEQARGARVVDARSDVFSLGCVLHACLTGESPFAGDDPLGVLAKILLEEPPPVGDLVPGVPVALEALLVRMLAKDPDERPRDGAALSAELKAMHARGELDAETALLRAPSLTSSEKRLVFVIVARGESPPPDAHLDPDFDCSRTYRLLPNALDELRATVAGYGGLLERLGGSVVVTLAGSGVATNQAARAARCSLALRKLLPDLPMALATGWEVKSERSALGAIIDRAVQLVRSHAEQRSPAEPEPTTPTPRAADGRPPRPVLVDDVTAGLVGNRFDIGGNERVLHLRGEREVVAVGRTLLGRPSPCVGRERDLAVLTGLYDECVAEPVARPVLVLAPSGAGKSRLRHELLEQLQQRGEPLEVWIAHGDPISAGSPFSMLAPAIRRAAGIQDGEPLVARRKKLRARIGRHLQGTHLQRVTEFVGEIVGVPFPESESLLLRTARQNATLLGDQMRRALEEWLWAETEAQPLILVLEDLHWGDVASVKLIDSVLRTLKERPLMVLALARPELHEVFPRLWEDRDVQVIRLAQLTRKASEKLIREMLGERATSQVVARLVERSAGNAFYLEELIRAVAEGKHEALPETVLAMVQARLEELGPEARRVLRAASVFGEVFWRGGLAELLGGAGSTLELSLRDLVEREVITVRGEGKFPGELEYKFRHAIVRDAAYAMLTEGDRILGHRLAGAWLEQAGESDPMVLAEHFERGGERPRACQWYQRAAEQARDGNDHAGALAAVERAFHCGAAGPPLGALRLLQAEAHKWRGETAEAEQRALEAIRLLPSGTASWYHAIGEAAANSGKLGHRDELVGLVDVMLAVSAGEAATGAQATAAARAASQLVYVGRADLADRLLALVEPHEESFAEHEPGVSAWVCEARAIRYGIAGGDPSGRLRLATLARAKFAHAGDVRNACLQGCSIGTGYLDVGAIDDGIAELERTVVAGEKMGLNNVCSVARTHLAMALAHLGRIGEAEQLEAATARAWKAQENQRMEGWSRLFLARILAMAGKLDEAEAEARTAVEILSVSPPLRVWALASLAQAELVSGRPAQALETARHAVDMLTSLGGYEAGESFVLLVHAEAMRACHPEEAAAAIEQAHRRLLHRSRQIRYTAWRESFLTGVPENARTLRLAREWGAV